MCDAVPFVTPAVGTKSGTVAFDAVSVAVGACVRIRAHSYRYLQCMRLDKATPPHPVYPRNKSMESANQRK